MNVLASRILPFGHRPIFDPVYHEPHRIDERSFSASPPLPSLIRCTSSTPLEPILSRSSMVFTPTVQPWFSPSSCHLSSWVTSLSWPLGCRSLLVFLYLPWNFDPVFFPRSSSFLTPRCCRVSPYGPQAASVLWPHSLLDDLIRSPGFKYHLHPGGF